MSGDRDVSVEQCSRNLAGASYPQASDVPGVLALAGEVPSYGRMR